MSTTNIIPLGTPSFTSRSLAAQDRTNNDWLTVATVTGSGSFSERVVIDLSKTGEFTYYDFTIHGNIGTATADVEWGILAHSADGNTIATDMVRLLREDSTDLTSAIRLQIQATAAFSAIDADLSLEASPSGDTTTVLNDLVVWTAVTNEEEVFAAVDPTTLLATDTAEGIRDKLQTLTNNARLDASAINFVDGIQTVYVSGSGDDTADGRSPESPVLTLAQATTLASAFPLTSKRLIKCVDASSFTENIAFFTPIDLELPFCTLTGNISNSTAARCEMNIGLLAGNLSLTNGSHYTIGQMNGDIVIGNCATAAAFLHIEDYVGGTFLDNTAVGDVQYSIIHDTVGITLNPTVSYNPYGFVGDDIYASGTSVRDRLQTLTGDDRLDAAFVKNIPAGGTNPHDTTDLVGVAGTNGWYDLVTWPTNPAGTSDTHGADFILYINNGSGTVVTQRINVNFPQGIANPSTSAMIRLIGRITSGLTGGGTYRVIQDSTDVNDVVRLQVEVNSGNTYSGLMSSALPLQYPAGVDFGGWALYTPTGNEVILTEISTTNWGPRDVIDGTSGGMACSSIGEHGTNQRAFIDFAGTDGHVDIHTGPVTTGKFSDTGTRLSAGEYGSWAAPKVDEWPIDSAFWTDLTAQKRPAVGDTSLNPSSTVTWIASDTGGVTQATSMPGFDLSHQGLRFGLLGSGGLAMTLSNCLFQRITLEFFFGVGTSSGGNTQDYELIDSNGVKIVDFTIPAASNNVGSTHRFTHDFTTGSGDTTFTLRKRSTGTSQAVYLYNYNMTINVDEPDLEPLVVVQQDSPLRGTLLPRIIPQPTGHVQGSMALNGLADNRPIWYDGSDWSYVTTTRIASGDPEGQFFFAEGNTLADSGWTGSQTGRWVNTENHAGFPEVIRCTQTGGTITLQAPNNTQAFWDTCRANGFRTDLRIMFGAAHDGQIWVDIEPNNTSWGSNGRFEFNFTVASGQLQLTMINTGGNTTFNLDRDTMYLVSMINSPGEDVCDIHVDGVKVGEVTYAGGGTTDRGTFFYTPPGNAVNDMSIQSITTYTIASASTDVTLDRESIRTGLRYNIPNINAPVNIRVPKGLYDFGNTFTIVNGASEVATVSGEVGDHQLFGGGPSLEVFPQKEVTFTQTASPRGNVWAVEGGRYIINHDDNTSTGHSLHLVLSNTATVIGRHGNYLGDVTPRRVLPGQYAVTLGSHVLGEDAVVTATARNITNEVRDVQYSITLGEVWVDIKDDTGTLVDGQVCISIFW